MTTSSPLNRRATVRRTLGGWFTYLRVAIVLVGVMASLWHDNGYNHGFRLVVVTGVLILVVGLFGYAFRCPRCGRSLLLEASVILMTRKTCACPRCGLNLDEPCP
jgi:predicted membrane channel-forming protein YqfA (hemolysin III family)